MRSALVLAHQGGWDEILLVLAPVGAIVGLLLMAKRRIEREHQAGHEQADLPPRE